MNHPEVYPDDVQIKHASTQLFDRFNIPCDAYTAEKFSIYVGNFPIHLPNIPLWVKVARFHDIHHVLTGYPANWGGEVQSGAWSLTSACRNYPVVRFF